MTGEGDLLWTPSAARREKSHVTAFTRWLESRCKHLRSDGSLQLMYRIDGSEDLPELILEYPPLRDVFCNDLQRLIWSVHHAAAQPDRDE